VAQGGYGSEAVKEFKEGLAEGKKTLHHRRMEAHRLLI
jgi:hypothetical protein